MMVNYKVVRNENGKLLSAVMDRPELCIEYQPGKWVRAKIGGILVFSTKKAAFKSLNLLNFEANLELWACYTKHPVKLPKHRLVVTHDPNCVKALWAGNFENLQPWEYRIWYPYLSYWPSGTKAYREVKLLKKVFSPRQQSEE
jgi:hypothetical protein